MNYEEYVQGVNKTWKKADGMIELSHCRLALLEEVGEISGWYKKHVGYGRPKDETILNGLKEEFGDLLYYIVKTGELTKKGHLVSAYFKEGLDAPKIEDVDYIGCMEDTARKVLDIMAYSPHTTEFAEALIFVMNNLMTLIYFEGYDLEDIMFSNLAKLSARHGDKFKDSAAVEEGRDRDTENKAIDG